MLAQLSFLSFAPRHRKFRETFAKVSREGYKISPACSARQRVRRFLETRTWCHPPCPQLPPHAAPLRIRPFCCCSLLVPLIALGLLLLWALLPTIMPAAAPTEDPGSSSDGYVQPALPSAQALIDARAPSTAPKGPASKNAALRKYQDRFIDPSTRALLEQDREWRDTAEAEARWRDRHANPLSWSRNDI